MRRRSGLRPADKQEEGDDEEASYSEGDNLVCSRSCARQSKNLGLRPISPKIESEHRSRYRFSTFL
jgi:hypothetical protein